MGLNSEAFWGVRHLGEEYKLGITKVAWHGTFDEDLPYS